MADGLQLDLSGMAEINRILAKLKDEHQEKIMRVAMRGGAQVIARQAKAMAKQTVYDTGSTMRGISAIALRTRPGDPKVRSKVGVRYGRRKPMPKGRKRKEFKLRKGMVRDPFYWWFHELGTQKMRPRPFMQPAMQASAQAALDRIRTVAERELIKLVNQTVKREMDKVLSNFAGALQQELANF